jgi:hypothetical protein
MPRTASEETAEGVHPCVLSLPSRGAPVCSNNLAVPLQAADDAILSALESQSLDDDVVTEAVRRAIAQVRVGCGAV